MMSNTGIKGVPDTFNSPLLIPRVSISFFHLAEALPDARATEFIEKCYYDFLHYEDMVDPLE